MFSQDKMYLIYCKTRLGALTTYLHYLPKMYLFIVKLVQVL
jgi:hypothetical protein